MQNDASEQTILICALRLFKHPVLVYSLRLQAIVRSTILKNYYYTTAFFEAQQKIEVAAKKWRLRREVLWAFYMAFFSKVPKKFKSSEADTRETTLQMGERQISEIEQVIIVFFMFRLDKTNILRITQKLQIGYLRKEVHTYPFRVPIHNDMLRLGFLPYFLLSSIIKL